MKFKVGDKVTPIRGTSFLGVKTFNVGEIYEIIEIALEGELIGAINSDGNMDWWNVSEFVLATQLINEQKLRKALIL